MGRNNFPEGNFRFMTSYPLLGRITNCPSFCRQDEPDRQKWPEERHWEQSLRHNLCFQLPPVGWEFSIRRGAPTTVERIPNERQGTGTKVGLQKYYCIRHFWPPDNIADILQLDGKRMDINDKKSVSTQNLPEFQIWTKIPSLGLNRSPQNDGHLYSVKALEFDF